MWEFIKAAPVVSIIGGVLLLGIIVGIVVRVVLKGRWEDHGLMKRNGKKLYWPSLPILTIFHPDLPLVWRATFLGASIRFTNATGIRFFMEIDTPPGYNFDQPPPIGSGLLVIQPKDNLGLMQVETATTEHRYNKKTGEIFAATITVPAQLKIRMPIMVHEIGHVLGLSHDENQSSIMYPIMGKKQETNQLSKKDIDLLKKTYNKK